MGSNFNPNSVIYFGQDEMPELGYGSSKATGTSSFSGISGSYIPFMFDFAGFEVRDSANDTLYGMTGDGNTAVVAKSTTKTEVTVNAETDFSGNKIPTEIIPHCGCAGNMSSLNMHSSITTYNFPSSIKKIGNKAFYNSPFLVTVNGLTGVDEFMGTDIFNGDGNLTNCQISGTYEELPYDCFNNCISLESFEIPASVITIGDGVFAGTCNLKTLTFASGSKCETIGKNFLANYSYGRYTPVMLDNSTQGNNYNGTKANLYLKEVIIPEGVKRLGGSAFNYDIALTKVVLPSTLEMSGSFKTTTDEDGNVTYALNGTLSIFDYCPNVVVYSRASKAGDYWNSKWNEISGDSTTAKYTVFSDWAYDYTNKKNTYTTSTVLTYQEGCVNTGKTTIDVTFGYAG